MGEAALAPEVVGGQKMIAGSLIASVSTAMTFLVNHSHEIGVLCMLTGTALGVAGFIQNRKVIFARERRERNQELRSKEEHELRMTRRMTDVED